MSVLLSESFQDDPAGALPAGWTTTGQGLLRVDTGRAHLTPGDTNGYAQRALNGVATKFTAYFMFNAGGVPTICLINCGNEAGQTYFDQLNMRMHLVIRPDQIVWQIRVDDGSEVPAFESVWGAGFAPELPRLTLLGLAIDIAAGGVVTLSLPNGDVQSFTDARISDMLGDQVVIQCLRAAPGAGLDGEWIGVNAEGVAYGPAEWITFEELVNELNEDSTDDYELTSDEEQRLRRVFDAAKQFTERIHAGRYDFAGTDLEKPGPDAGIVLGTLMLAKRWHVRRRSPAMLVAAADMGSARVPWIDEDINRNLRIGRHTPPEVG